MLNRTNFVLFQRCNRGSSVTWVLYTARRHSLGRPSNGDAGVFDLKTMNCFHSTNGWVSERSGFRRLITDKRRKRSRFVERLVKLDQESYERHASVGARGEQIGN
jgi:hypothetical protein